MVFVVLSLMLSLATASWASLSCLDAKAQQMESPCHEKPSPEKKAGCALCLYCTATPAAVSDVFKSGAYAPGHKISAHPDRILFYDLLYKDEKPPKGV